MARIDKYQYYSSERDIICVTLRGWIKSAATHFISYKVRASRTVYTDCKLLQKSIFSTVYTSTKPQTVL